MALLLALVSAFVIGIGMVMAVYVGITKLPEYLAQRKLQGRLEELSSPIEETTTNKALIKTSSAGPLPALERMISGTERGNGFSRWIEQSGMKVSTSGVLLVALFFAAVFAFLITMLTRSSWGIPAGAVIGFALPLMFLKFKRTRRLRAFEEMFPEALDLIARALKAGHAFATGLKMAADELSEPVGPEFRKTFDEQNFGLPLKDALENLTLRIPILDVRFFATAVLIQRETGGNLSEILENLAHVVRERFKFFARSACIPLTAGSRDTCSWRCQRFWRSRCRSSTPST